MSEIFFLYKGYILRGPIVIGGIGGSGTRIVAQIIMECNFYLGTDLSAANDNLWFTLLFRRPAWFRCVLESNDDSDIYDALKIFRKAMQGTALDQIDIELIDQAISDLTPCPQGIEWANPDPWLESLRSFMDQWLKDRRSSFLNVSSCVDLSIYRGWGWKEPNSHIFLPYFCRFLEDLTYIHVIRHGIDMAYSGNQNQVKLWGSMYGINQTDEQIVPASSFHYWIRANQKAISLGEKLLGDRFLRITYEELCSRPEKEIKRLIEFLGLSLSEETLARINKIPSPPASIGRYKEHNTSWTTDDDVRSLNLMGYEY